MTPKIDYSELTKCYPNFKIPVFEYSDYYIDTLLKAGIVTERPIQQLEALSLDQTNISKYKMSKLDEILNYFKEKEYDLNKLDFESGLFNKGVYSLKDFNNYKPNKFYVSIDLKEANWQAFKRVFNLDLPDWENWSQQTFNLHPFISESKSFRQLVFGNTNPKRIQAIQKQMMLDICNVMPINIKEAIVSTKSDEIVLEFDEYPSDHLFMFNYFGKVLNYKISIDIFTIELVKSFGEMVRLKNIFTQMDKVISETKMINVPGNRFFIHLKNLILKQKLDQKDLYFENDNKLAQWVIQ